VDYLKKQGIDYCTDRNYLDWYKVEIESCYPIKNGKVTIREIDKNSEKELDEVVEVNRSNVKRWHKRSIK